MSAALSPADRASDVATKAIEAMRCAGITTGLINSSINNLYSIQQIIINLFFH